MTLKDKLLSRKLWLAVIGAGAGIAIALGAPENIVSVLVGAATALVSVVIYIVTEGKIDAQSVSLSADFIQSVLVAIAEFNAKNPDAKIVADSIAMKEEK